MAYGHIVVGADGSGGSMAAVTWAAEVAARRGAEVSLVHGLAPAVGMIFAIPPLRYKELKGDVRRELSGAWAEPLRRAGVEFETILAEDVAAVALLSSARKTDAVLLVLGRHGHTRFGPHVLGGVTHKVLSDPTCPVVVVPTSWEGSRDQTQGRIVVGVDGSESSLVALTWAIQHAEAFEWRVRAVTAVFTQVYTDVAWLAATDEAKAGRLAEEMLGQIVQAKRAETEIDIEMQVLAGHAGESLVKESESADLVVVGSRGLGAVAAHLAGSTSHFVAARSSCPTVMVT